VVGSEYLIETAGWNIRVYEWIPADNPNTRCMFAAGSRLYLEIIYVRRLKSEHRRFSAT
jgi:hypothetical protein